MFVRGRVRKGSSRFGLVSEGMVVGWRRFVYLHFGREDRGVQYRTVMVTPRVPAGPSFTQGPFQH